MLIYINSGTAVDEVCLGVFHFYNWLQKNYDIEVINLEKGSKKNTLKSILIQTNDKNINKLQGTILWVCQSPFRPNHKRKNWFFSLKCYETNKNYDFDEKHIQYQTMKSPKKGGQHVNTTNSGVRAVYPPLNLSAISYDERSQHKNKKIAFFRLIQKIDNLNNSKKNKQNKTIWKDGKLLARGGEISLKFIGTRFKMVAVTI